MHWKRRVIMFERATSCSTWPPRPSASPLSRSKATIMKSLSGASYWSGCWLYICVNQYRTHNEHLCDQGGLLRCVWCWRPAHHGLGQRLLDKGDAALINRLTVRQKPTLQCCGYWWQALRKHNKKLNQSYIIFTKGNFITQLSYLWVRSAQNTDLQQREKILVFIFKLVPLGNQWRHQFLNVLLQNIVDHQEFARGLYHFHIHSIFFSFFFVLNRKPNRFGFLCIDPHQEQFEI